MNPVFSCLLRWVVPKPRITLDAESGIVCYTDASQLSSMECWDPTSILMGKNAALHRGYSMHQHSAPLSAVAFADRYKVVYLSQG
jgi:hypothetical protein